MLRVRRWVGNNKIRVAALFTGTGAMIGGLVGGTGPLMAVVVGILAAVPVLLVEERVRRMMTDARVQAEIESTVEVTADPPADPPDEPDRPRWPSGVPDIEVPPVALEDLPAPAEGLRLSTFRGRSDELQELLELHDRERAARHEGAADRAAAGAVLLLIHGSPGVGKSVLGRELARQLAPQYPDGLIYANFGMAGGMRPAADILGIFLRALGRTDMPDAVGERASIFRSLTAGRKMLFVFDAARNHDQVLQVLPTDPDCTVIATSRRDLGPALGAAPRPPLEVPTLAGALEILGAIAQTDWVSQAEHAVEVVELCGRLPLAIRSAGERVALDGTDLRHVADLLRPPRTRLQRLERGGHGVRERMASEYGRLGAREQEALRLLSLVPSPTFVPWVLSPLLDVESDEAQNVMASLGAARLLDTAGTDALTGLARYRFNPLYRLFAEAMLAEWVAGEEPAEEIGRAERIEAVGQAYDEACRTAVGHILGDPAFGVRAEYHNLIRVVAAAQRGSDWALCWRVAARLHGCVPYGSDHKSTMEAFHQATQAAQRAGEQFAEIDVHLAKAAYLIAVERYPDAFKVLAEADRRAVQIQVDTGTRVAEAKSRRAVAHRMMAEAYVQMGGYREAAAPLRMAADLATEPQEALMVAVLEAETHRVLGPYPEDDVLDGRHEDPVRFRYHLSQSEAARRRRDWAAAEEHLLSAAEHSSDDARRMAAVHYRLARLAVDQWRHSVPHLGLPRSPSGQPEPDGPDIAELPRRAVRFAAEAVLEFRRMGNLVGLARAQCMQVRALVAAGALVDADRLCHGVARSLVGLQVLAGPAWTPLVARFARARGELLLHRGDIATGWETLVIAGALYEDNDDWACRSEVWRLLAAAQETFPYPPGVGSASIEYVLREAMGAPPPSRLPLRLSHDGLAAVRSPIVPRQRPTVA